MIEERTRVLIATVHKFMNRGAKPNIIRILRKTHAADLALLLQHLVSEERLEIFQMIDSLEKRAEVLARLRSEVQQEFVHVLSKEELLKLVGLMDSDDAADFLGTLSDETSKEILSQMVKEDSQEVADLMGYPEDSAGGIMSSEYLSFNQMKSVAEAIETIQREGDEGHVTFYLYVVNDSQQLVGVVSLKQLLLSKRVDLLKSIMYTDVISVRVDTDQDEVATIVQKYDFLALPVVDGNNQLVGVITVDDVIDVIRESAEEDLLAMGKVSWGPTDSFFDYFKARVPWILWSFGGGSMCFGLIYLFGLIADQTSAISIIWLVTAFIPMVLTMGTTVGSQSATVMVGGIRSGGFDMGMAKLQFLKEISVAFILSVVFGLIVFMITRTLFPLYSLEWIFSLTLGLQIFLSMTIGALVPILLYRFKIDPTAISVPFLTVISELIGMLILFLLVVRS